MIKSILCALLILLYTYAATSKLFDLSQFRQQLHNQTFPGWLDEPLLYGLPVMEILTALLLFFRRTILTGLYLSLGLLMAFTAYISLVMLHYWDRVPCSCGGILSHMSWTSHLAFNWAFLILNVTAIWIHRLQTSPVPHQ